MKGAGCHDRLHTMQKIMPATNKSKAYITDLYKNKDQVKQYLTDKRTRLGLLHKPSPSG